MRPAGQDGSHSGELSCDTAFRSIECCMKLLCTEGSAGDDSSFWEVELGHTAASEDWGCFWPRVLCSAPKLMCLALQVRTVALLGGPSAVTWRCITLRSPGARSAWHRQSGQQAVNGPVQRAAMQCSQVQRAPAGLGSEQHAVFPVEPAPLCMYAAYQSNSIAAGQQAVRRPEDRQHPGCSCAVARCAMPVRVCHGTLEDRSTQHQVNNAMHFFVVDLPQGEMQILQDSAQQLQWGLRCKTPGSSGSVQVACDWMRY